MAQVTIWCIGDAPDQAATWAVAQSVADEIPQLLKDPNALVQFANENSSALILFPVRNIVTVKIE
jgi:hypothetical protein